MAVHEEKEASTKGEDVAQGAAVPAYLLDREGTNRAKVLSNTIKQKRKEKAGKWSVPLPKVKPVADDEMFRIVQTGKRKGTRDFHFCSFHFFSLLSGKLSVCVHAVSLLTVFTYEQWSFAVCLLGFHRYVWHD